MRTVKFGIIGPGLMGREFASAAARWLHLPDMDINEVNPFGYGIAEFNQQGIQKIWLNDFALFDTKWYKYSKAKCFI